MVGTGKGDTSKLVLQWQDVYLVAGSIQIHICQSKVDQHGKGVYLTLLHCHMEDLCPVKATASYLRIRGAGQEHFFIHRHSSPLTKYQFWRLTDLALNKVGVSAKQPT